MSKKYQDKKEEVLYMAERGYGADEICKQTGIPRGSIFHYLKMWGVSLVKARYGTPSDQRVKNKSKWDSHRDVIEKMVNEGSTLPNISKTVGVPLGSLTFLLKGWGLQGKAELARGNRLTEVGRRAVSFGVSESHHNGSRVHPTKSLYSMHGQFVRPDVVREELEFYIAQDLTIKEMAALLQVDPRSVTKYMRELGLQQGPRREKRHYNFKGYVKRYRGADWLPNRELALERDGYKCTKCGKTREEEKAMTKRDLHVHHLVPWVECQTNIVDNLITVCESCHKAIHTGELSTVNLGIK